MAETSSALGFNNREEELLQTVQVSILIDRLGKIQEKSCLTSTNRAGPESENGGAGRAVGASEGGQYCSEKSGKVEYMISSNCKLRSTLLIPFVNGILITGSQSEGNCGDQDIPAA